MLKIAIPKCDLKGYGKSCQYIPRRSWPPPPLPLPVLSAPRRHRRPPLFSASQLHPCVHQSSLFSEIRLGVQPFQRCRTVSLSQRISFVTVPGALSSRSAPSHQSRRLVRPIRRTHLLSPSRRYPSKAVRCSAVPLPAINAIQQASQQQQRL
ncbi:hypothetical protein PIB30_032510 [Stylosanthes scabra]|uniref:Uncharacterized protein n=1 Tax=Stylosanthes scabra TaxID=79078 RepID=A0ABU6WAN6_9FABA|nr:hypothetical protein [Stylosanthes scabra]